MGLTFVPQVSSEHRVAEKQFRGKNTLSHGKIKRCLVVIIRHPFFLEGSRVADHVVEWAPLGTKNKKNVKNIPAVQTVVVGGVEQKESSGVGRERAATGPMADERSAGTMGWGPLFRTGKARAGRERHQPASRLHAVRTKRARSVGREQPSQKGVSESEWRVRKSLTPLRIASNANSERLLENIGPVTTNNAIPFPDRASHLELVAFQSIRCRPVQRTAARS